MDRWRAGDLLGRPVVGPALAWLAGAWSAVPGGHPGWAVAGGLGLLGALLPTRPLARWLLLACGFFAWGRWTAGEAWVAPPQEARRYVGPARVAAAEELRDGRQRLEVDLLDGSGRARLTAWPAGAEALAGTELLLDARLRPLAPPGNPGEADWASAKLRDGVGWSGSWSPERAAEVAPAGGWARWRAAQQERFAAQVRDLAPSADAAALYLALAAGMRAGMDEGLERDFARSGLAHVLSVSGVHVAGLALACVAALRLFLVMLWSEARRWDVRRLAAPLSLPLAWLYVAWTGWQGPAVRSAVMLSLGVIALAAARRPDAPSLLGWAALCMCAAWPAGVADLSLRLSFLALAGLLVLAPALRGALPWAPPHEALDSRWPRLRRFVEPLISTACASAAAVAFSMPLVSEAFGQVSLAGIASNVACLPLVGGLTLLAAGGPAVFAVAPALAPLPVWLGTHAAGGLVAAAGHFAGWPGAAVTALPLGTAAAAAWMAGLLAWSVGRGRWRWFGLLAPAALGFGLVPLPVSWGPGLVVTFLSVGQGDSVVVSSRGAHLLVDGGGVPGGMDPGERVVLPFLRASHVDRLALAVLSHPHPDHALGLATVLRSIPTQALWLPATPPDEVDGPLARAVVESAGRASVVRATRGLAPVRLGEATVEVLGPPPEASLLESVNDRSVVLGITHGRVRVLLTRDVEAAAEEALPAWRADVVKVPHHGSATSSTAGFLQKTRPRVAVFCVGRANRFGFPAPDVTARYEQAGARCYRTDLHGAVRVESDGETVRVVPFHPEGSPLVAGAA
ncbi:MAG: ComEC/Rec2 family competence protein, partial [Deltaproteobacteria bacterium]|nr:ComEC/Rec2 family competence protein [Deltaproteobacteria bacterium]